MNQKEFTIDGYDYLFRFAKMNAIEILALETQFNFGSLRQSQSTIENVLERIEIKIGETWSPVKMKDRQVYLPDVIETDVNLISKLLSKFTKELIEPVFQKSEESN